MSNEDFYASLPEKLTAAMDARGARKAVIIRDLARYYDLMERGSRNLDGLFNDNELHFLADITSSTILDARYIEALPFAIEDAMVDYGKHWEIDAASILGKVRSLNQAAQYALLDGLERFWRMAGTDQQMTPQAIVQVPELAESLVVLTHYDEYYSQ